MARAGIASFRVAEGNFETTYAQVISRAHLMAHQNMNTDWVKIRAKFTRGAVKKMSALPDDDEETAEETRLLNEMDLEEALKGSEMRDKKCPFFWYNFMLAAGRPVIAKDAPAAPEQVKILVCLTKTVLFQLTQSLSPGQL